MSADEKPRPSFSPAGRWQIGSDVMLRTVLVLAVMGMVNFLAAKFFHRFHLSSQTQDVLSSHSLNIVHALTNHVDVTLYYDREADTYPVIEQLLDKEYRAANKNISVRTVDYVRDPGAAEMIKQKYQQFFESPADTNLVIFDSGGRVKVLPGDKLTRTQYDLVGWHPGGDDPKNRQLEFKRRPIDFNGEQAFTSILLALEHPQPLKAYYLSEGSRVKLDDLSTDLGFGTFVTVLEQNYISVENLNWIPPTGVPVDCNVLIIAAPMQAYDESQLTLISQYLHEGGKLFVLFNAGSVHNLTGLEQVLLPWGIGVQPDVAQDFNLSTRAEGYDMVVMDFNKHPVVDALSQMQLHLYTPRPIIKLNTSQVANAPQVTELFATTPQGTLMYSPNLRPLQYPLALAVEQKPVAGVSSPRGNSRIIAVGDSTFLGNTMIDSAANRDFLINAVNWLCDQPLMLAGIGPRPVTDYRLHITLHQERQLAWLLLAVLPGGVFVFGWFIWFVRRK